MKADIECVKSDIDKFMEHPIFTDSHILACLGYSFHPHANNLMFLLDKYYDVKYEWLIKALSKYPKDAAFIKKLHEDVTNKRFIRDTSFYSRGVYPPAKEGYKYEVNGEFGCGYYRIPEQPVPVPKPEPAVPDINSLKQQQPKTPQPVPVAPPPPAPAPPTPSVVASMMYQDIMSASKVLFNAIDRLNNTPGIEKPALVGPLKFLSNIRRELYIKYDTLEKKIASFDDHKKKVDDALTVLKKLTESDEGLRLLKEKKDAVFALLS
jgi:hypothetical protein